MKSPKGTVHYIQCNTWRDKKQVCFLSSNNVIKGKSWTWYQQESLFTEGLCDKNDRDSANWLTSMHQHQLLYYLRIFCWVLDRVVTLPMLLFASCLRLALERNSGSKLTWAWHFWIMLLAWTWMASRIIPTGCGVQSLYPVTVRCATFVLMGLLLELHTSRDLLRIASIWERRGQEQFSVRRREWSWSEIMVTTVKCATLGWKDKTWQKQRRFSGVRRALWAVGGVRHTFVEDAERITTIPFEAGCC